MKINNFESFSNKKLYLTLNFPVFNKEPHLFSNKGKVLYIFKQFKQNKEPMVSIFHYTGIIDTILSKYHLFTQLYHGIKVNIIGYIYE